MHPITATRLLLAEFHLDRLWKRGIISYFTYRHRKQVLGGML